jgi:DNA-binding NarL/FixJ family response regulator
MLEKVRFVKEIHEVENGQEAISLLAQHAIDVILLDIRMPLADGFEVISYHHRLNLPARIIALTAFDEEAMIFNLMREGIPGILFKKTTHQQEIYTAIEAVMEGKHYYHEKVSVVLDSKPEGLQNPPRIKLSAREFEVIVHLCHGLSTKDIAEKLFLSDHTIEGYRKEIIKKTNTRNTNELIHYAVSNGIVTS